MITAAGGDTGFLFRTPQGEPRVNADDKRLWLRWRELCLRHAEGSVFARRVERAVGDCQRFLSDHPRAHVAWSAGKDSTVCAHLWARAGGKWGMSVKDDLDYPGEVEYIDHYAGEWGLSVDVMSPAFRLQGWLKACGEGAGGASAGDDFHSRTTEFSQRAFYVPIERWNEVEGWPGVVLGLRADESWGRAMNFYTRGSIYETQGRGAVCIPIGGWKSIDVYAYLFAHGIEPFHVYKCVRLFDDPGRVRKSWWLPGTSARHGQSIWLKTYYPSLWGQLRGLLVDAGVMT